MDDEQKNLRERFRDRPDLIASYLTDAFAENDLDKVLLAINQVMRAQNVQALARESGLRRDKLYTTFGGRVDPQLSRILKMFKALNIRFTVVPSGPRETPVRPRLGRPRKNLEV